MEKSVSSKNKRVPYLGLTQLFKNKFPYISLIDKSSDFKIGMQLGSAKAHHKMPPRKSGVTLS